MSVENIGSDHRAEALRAAPPTPPSYSAPILRVELRVCFVCQSEHVTTGLGYMDGGQWVAPPFVDEFTEFDPDELIDWLCEDQLSGAPLALSRDLAAAMVNDTFERCRALAAASAAQRSV